MPKCFIYFVTAVISSVVLYIAEAATNSQPNGQSSYLLKGGSTKHLVETASDHQWSINFEKINDIDSIHIIALRVQFKEDTSALTTGNGRFFTSENLKKVTGMNI